MKYNTSPLDSNICSLGSMLASSMSFSSLRVLTHCFWNLHLQDVHLAAVNFVIQKGPTEQEDLLSVTLCSLGSAEAYLAQDPKATLLKPQHAWHHPAS